MRKGYRKPRVKCSVADCEKNAVARGWCGTHWQRWRNGQSPHEKSIYEKGDAERFWEVPLCVNPKHLMPGTHLQNMQDKAEKGRDTGANKTHCKHGHPRIPENIYVTSQGLKQCRVCHRLTQYARQHRITRYKEQRTS